MEQKELTITSQYLAFTLEDEIFAFDISKVREVLEFTTITKVPQTPPMMKGVINLRGSVVPVIDMRVKFDITEAEKTVNTVIIIVEINIDDDVTLIGAIVDAVKEVVNLSDDQIEAPPKMGNNLNTEYIQGMGKKDDQFIIILDIEKIFSTEELDMVIETSQNEPVTLE